ncbi:MULTISPECIES: DUF4287 domain-containing protein [unclassified Leucobacter]|uniref:DUF4287 domain-containing protein n=1 Tax=unclassified Leucobacter TaxID=2621730 RepID=UPI00165EAFDE|nr:MULTISPECIES: DUF4287 domain-containing protein [unclassified Leucobacter]MBC9928194.1 DUF4287 domain-containing protein [Leucobacter sp. cx-169]MBC9936860.1 DUF4287 domain-containing protein [Leucobacter sp. cx-87]
MTEKVQGPKSYFPSIEAKYGKSIDEWFETLAPHAGKKHMDQVAFLKELGVGHGHANALVHVFRAEHGGAGEGETA